MSYMFTSDAAEVRTSANRLREYAGLIGDEEAAGKLLRLAGDLDAWASRQEQIAGDISTPYDGIGADVVDISAARSRPAIIRHDRIATGDGTG